jgi:hypothetical protein
MTVIDDRRQYSGMKFVTDSLAVKRSVIKEAVVKVFVFTMDCY